MKILLFGKDGQVGGELQRRLGKVGEVIAPGRDSTELCGDLAQLAAIAGTVRQVRPDVIINAAAYTAVDKAESDVEAACRINADAPGVLAAAAEACGAWLVHYSTDYVFDGSGTRPWTELDRPAPLNVYGRTKLEGERLIVARCARYMVLRTSWIYSRDGTNFAKTMLRLAASNDSLRVVDDQVGAPTSAALLADMTLHALQAARQDASKAGLYHLAAAGETSWHGYARFLVDRARAAGLPVAVHNDAIAAVASSAFPAPAVRPLNSRLDTTRFQREFGVALPPWEEGVAMLVDHISAGLKP